MEAVDYVSFIENVDYESTNTSKSLLMGRENVNDDCLWLKWDVISDHDNEIYNILIQGNDYYSKEREPLQKMAFKYNDGNASEKIWNVIEEYLS